MPEDALMQPPTGQPASTTVAAPQSTTFPADAGDTSKPRQNAHDNPEFRALQSQYDRQKAELERQLTAAREEAERLKLDTMTDTERLAYRAEQAESKLREAAEAQQVAEARRSVLNELVQKTGVPLAVLENAASRADAYEAALDYLLRSTRESANKSDLGTGRAATGDDWESEYQRAQRERNVGALFQAAQRGSASPTR